MEKKTTLSTKKTVDPEREALRKTLRTTPDAGETMARLAGAAALDKKAEDVVLVDLREQSSYTDFLVLCSGASDRQLTAIADSVEKALKDAGHKLGGSEGHAGGRWVLLDAGDLVVHVFHVDERAHYDLEGLWADAPQSRLEPKATVQ